jgi:hypothetical protein
MSSNLRNNSLSGTIPDSLRELKRLVYLDLSNNQLTGTFPTWAHNLTGLTVLNLGQNEFSGEIPLFIGGGRNDGRRRLIPIREFIRLLSTSDAPFRYRERYGFLLVKFFRFFKKHPYIRYSKDLLWIDHGRSYWGALNLQEVIEEYIKAEDNYLLTKIFKKVRNMDPLLLIDKFNLASTLPISGH